MMDELHRQIFEDALKTAIENEIKVKHMWINLIISNVLLFIVTVLLIATNI